MSDSPDPSLPARRLRGTFLLLWTPALVACFLPLVLGLSPARAVPVLVAGLGSERAGDTIFLDRPTEALLLALALGTCVPLLALPWRLAFGWRAPRSAATRATGNALAGLLLAMTVVAAAMLVFGVTRGDESSLGPLLGVGVGLLSLAVLRLPRWRELPLGSRRIGALDGLHLACTLGALAVTAHDPSPGWWAMAFGALVAAAELAMLPRLE